MAGEDIAPDAVLATDLGDEEERFKEQLAHLGGELDEIDEEDLSAEDRGDSIGDPEEVAARQAAAKDEDEKDDDGEAEEEEGEETDEPAEEDSDADESEEDVEDGEQPEGEDEEADGEEEEPVKKTPGGIPKSRFDEVNERMKKAEADLAALRQEQEATQQAEENKYDFDVAEKEYIELVQDGKTDEALAKRKEIRAAEQQQYEASAASTSNETYTANTVRAEIMDLSKQAEELYPVFDDGHEDYDPAIINKAMTLFEAYSSSNEFSSPGDAFVGALADVVALYGLEDRYSALEDSDDPAPTPKPEKRAAKPKQTQKKLGEAKRSPPPVSSGGTPSKDSGAAVPDIEDLTDEELDALPEATLARLRGDLG